MKKFVSVILICVIMFSLIACGEERIIAVNVENPETMQNGIIGKDAMIEIGSGLYYDSNTRIVYWWNGELNIAYCATTPSPYYAPNGFPYRYNPETNTLEEIEVN